MIQYYYETFQGEQPETFEEEEQHRLIAIHDTLYYWQMEWRDVAEAAAVVDLHAGLLSEKIREQSERMEELSPPELRTRFGSMANYIERSVQGFRSYIRWISPDQDIATHPWKIFHN